MKRVVITGIGALTPLGATFEKSWMSVKQGLSGIGKITRFSDEGLKWKAAGEVPDRKTACLSAKELNFVDPFAVYAIAATREAIESALLLPDHISQAGIIIGSSRGGITTIEKEFLKMSSKTNMYKRFSPHLMPASTISSAASYVAMKFGIQGHCLGISNACASGTNAIGEAFRMIKTGQAHIMLAGGSEAPLCRFCIEGYGATGALSKSVSQEASRPFDVRRDGFVPAEGACIIVLEELDSALSRNAAILGEIAGYGNVCDAYHPTKPSIQGEMLAIEKALNEADVSSSDVDYINAHGTSTILGDKVEARAIRNIFGKSPVRVSSVKSMTGHMLAASGAFEVACTAMSLKEGFIPATINTLNIDPACPINLVTLPQKGLIKIAITNSFGFGGVNSVLAMKSFNPRSLPASGDRDRPYSNVTLSD
jgi:3-oxoacyl-[acyl-carrier-protein] synthase II